MNTWWPWFIIGLLVGVTPSSGYDSWKWEISAALAGAIISRIIWGVMV